jgi:SAM-dependent methyltransferase
VKLIERLHSRFVASRRAQVLAGRIAHLLPPESEVLDVGCGDGEIAWLIQQRRPDVRVCGVDVLVRENSRVPIEWFDGQRLPFADNSFDVVSFIDVLHHCDCQRDLLAEARRVARTAVVIKDHKLQGKGARSTLEFMDGVGNRRYGVALPFNYWTPDEWADAFAKLDLAVDYQNDRLGLYPWPLSLAFDRRLHFLARLTPAELTTGARTVDSVLATA